MGARYGRYETIRRLAAGGMATVHLGKTQGPGGFERLVAIKVMHEHIAADPAFRAMFLDEARLCARIRHPNVVATVDVAEDGRFIVMEYVEGVALDVWLREKREQHGEPLALGVTLRVMLDVLDGLHAAHELRDADGASLRLVHRDVSPQNVLVGVDGIARVGDFGIAYAASRLASTRGVQLKGKLPYMAPEQLEDGRVDRRADVYAAGCVLWEMLTGERLFQGSSDAAVACAVLAGPGRAPGSLAEVPEAIDAVCMRALMSQQERFESALDFAQALEQAAETAGIKLARPRQVGALVAEVSAPASSRAALSGHSAAGATPSDRERSSETAPGERGHSLHTDTGVVAPAGVPRPGQNRPALMLALAAGALLAGGAWLLSGSSSTESSAETRHSVDASSSSEPRADASSAEPSSTEPSTEVGHSPSARDVHAGPSAAAHAASASIATAPSGAAPNTEASGNKPASAQRTQPATRPVQRAQPPAAIGPLRAAPPPPPAQPPPATGYHPELP